jgi:hypothetical protein
MGWPDQAERCVDELNNGHHTSKCPLYPRKQLNVVTCCREVPHPGKHRFFKLFPLSIGARNNWRQEQASNLPGHEPSSLFEAKHRSLWKFAQRTGTEPAR